MNVNAPSRCDHKQKYTNCIQKGMLTKVPEKSYDLVTNNRISTGVMALEFLHFFIL